MLGWTAKRGARGLSGARTVKLLWVLLGDFHLVLVVIVGLLVVADCLARPN